MIGWLSTTPSPNCTPDGRNSRHTPSYRSCRTTLSSMGPVSSSTRSSTSKVSSLGIISADKKRSIAYFLKSEATLSLTIDQYSSFAICWWNWTRLTCTSTNSLKLNTQKGLGLPTRCSLAYHDCAQNTFWTQSFPHCGKRKYSSSFNPTSQCCLSTASTGESKYQTSVNWQCFPPCMSEGRKIMDYINTRH